MFKIGKALVNACSPHQVSRRKTKKTMSNHPVTPLLDENEKHSPNPTSPDIIHPSTSSSPSPSSAPSCTTINEQLSTLSDKYNNLHLPNAARFFAHQAHAFNPQSSESIMQLAKVYAKSGSHQQVIHVLKDRWHTDNAMKLLGALSLRELGQLDGCLELLGDDNSNNDTNCAALCMVKGDVYERLDNVNRAVYYYKRALQIDISCYDAFEKIVYSFLISKHDSQQYILDITSAFLNNNTDLNDIQSWLVKFYKSSVDSTFPIPLSTSTTTTSDIQFLKARRCYNTFNFKKCISILTNLSIPPTHLPTEIQHILLSSLVELNDRQTLFSLSHDMVQTIPKSSTPWLSVAYYYHTSNKPDVSRRFLRKATSMQIRLLPAWIALGHTFAMQDESDQAMAAYRTACRLFPGNSYSLLYMGMEYTRQGSLVQAEYYLQKSLKCYPDDPSPRHELGVVSYRSGDLHKAIKYFEQAVKLWDFGDDGYEEKMTSLINLAHCYRRVGQFENAKKCYKNALSLGAGIVSTCKNFGIAAGGKSGSTTGGVGGGTTGGGANGGSVSFCVCVGLGMTYHAMGELDAAVGMYHRALRECPGDAVGNELLERALFDMFHQSQV